jgi:Protein of unknown function (DUF3102)
MTIAPIDRSTDTAALAAHVAAIRKLGKRVVADVVAIGGHLKECQRIVGHGNWLRWLHTEFDWDERTARNLIYVHDMVGRSEKFSDLDLPVSSLYLLAAPSTPEAARTEVIERIEAGEQLKHDDVKAVIANTKVKDKNTTEPFLVERKGLGLPDEDEELEEEKPVRAPSAFWKQKLALLIAEIVRNMSTDGLGMLIGSADNAIRVRQREADRAKGEKAKEAKAKTKKSPATCEAAP